MILTDISQGGNLPIFYDLFQYITVQVDYELIHTIRLQQKNLISLTCKMVRPQFVPNTQIEVIISPYLSRKKNKKALDTQGLCTYAVERTRTSTGIHPLPPQDSVSAIPPRPQLINFTNIHIIYVCYAKVKMHMQ